MARANDTARSRRDGMGVAVCAGDAALILRVGRSIGPAVHRRVMRLLARLDAAQVPGVLDLVPAYASILVHFDPLLTTAPAILAALRATLRAAESATTAAPNDRPRRVRTSLVRIPVTYGGAAGPDLAAVAQQLGLSPAEVVRLHTSAIQRVYFIGFLAGYPYLGDLPPALAVPRLAVPRPRVAAGSVGIAGRQTGIYPVTSPGGWRLIGRADVALFDPARDPPALLRPGDRVRFVDRAHLPPSTPPPSTASIPARSSSAAPSAVPSALPWVRVVRPGAQTTVQDRGRRGYARCGVALAGAADRDALALGNLLLGNPPNAAALEITYGAAEFEALAPCLVALTGAACDLRLNGVSQPTDAVLPVPPGVSITLGPVRGGARAYLCVGGGIAVAPVLGSRSTDLRAAFGGLAGAALRADDVLERLPTASAQTGRAGAHLPADPVRDAAAIGQPCTLRVLPGPHARRFPADLAALLAGTFVVDVRSDRSGVRLRFVGDDLATSAPPHPLRATIGGEVLSEGVPDGAIQVPPGGEPILLLADHQTTGGYHIPAVVITADHWRCAQLRPGDTLRLARVSPAAACAALRDRQRWYAAVARELTTDDASRSAARLPDPAVLMRGFAEGSYAEAEMGVTRDDD